MQTTLPFVVDQYSRPPVAMRPSKTGGAVNWYSGVSPVAEGRQAGTAIGQTDQVPAQ